MSDRIAVMDGGKVQQVADPATLYELPRNRFVANFIGQTNLFSGIAESVESDRVTLRVADGTIVEATVREDAALQVGDEAHAAVRPEKVRFGTSGENVSTVRIKQVVYLGVSTQYITELPSGEKLVLYQQNAHDAAGYKVGEEVSVSWDASNCLVIGG
jgi:spermidine/putrescine transport system ATP-binding protein